MTPTQGTDRNVKPIRKLLAVGANQTILPAQAGVLYRVVGAQISMDAAGTFAVYHGTNTDANTFIDGYAAANGGSNPTPGDWADQGGTANEAIKADITGGNAKIVLNYIEIRVLG